MNSVQSQNLKGKEMKVEDTLPQNNEFYYKLLSEKEKECYTTLEQDTILYTKRTELDDLIKLNEEKKKELNDINVINKSNENKKLKEKLLKHMLQFEEFSTGNEIIYSAALKSGTKVLVNKKENKKSKVLKYYNDKSLSQMEEMNNTFQENPDIAMMCLTLDL